MNKWLKDTEESLAQALDASVGGDIPLENLYMLAPIIYSERNKINDDELIEEMIAENDQQVHQDWSIDENSKKRYKFHYVSSYLYCFVVSGKIDELKYDEIMEYVNNEMDLFTNG